MHRPGRSMRVNPLHRGHLSVKPTATATMREFTFMNRLKALHRVEIPRVSFFGATFPVVTDVELSSNVVIHDPKDNDAQSSNANAGKELGEKELGSKTEDKRIVVQRVDRCIQYGALDTLENDPKNIICNKCWQTGHKRAECDKYFCRNCRTHDHEQGFDCGQDAGPICNNCSKPGHFSKDCPEKKDFSKVKCNRCNNKGHIAENCPTRWACATCLHDTHRGDCPSVCRACKSEGHTIADCPTPTFVEAFLKKWRTDPQSSADPEAAMAEASVKPLKPICIPELPKKPVETLTPDQQHSEDLYRSIQEVRDSVYQGLINDVTKSTNSIGVSLELVSHQWSTHLALQYTCTSVNTSMPQDSQVARHRMELRVPPKAFIEKIQHVKVPVDILAEAVQPDLPVEAKAAAQEQADALKAAMSEEEKVTATQESEQKMKLLRSSFPNATADQLDAWQATSELQIIKFKVHNRELHGSNFFTMMHLGEFEMQMQPLRVMKDSDYAAFTLMMKAEETTVVAALDKFEQARQLYLIKAPWTRFWPKGTVRDRSLISFDKEIKIKAERPKFEDIPALINFTEFWEWLTVMFHRILSQKEAAEAAPKKDSSVARVIKFPHATDKVFFVALANVQAKEDDTIKISFSPNDTPDKHWNMIPLRNFPGVPVTDLAGILMRPFDPETGEWNDLKLPDERIIVEVGGKQTSEDLMKSLAENPGILVEVLYQRPINAFKRRCNALRDLSGEIGKHPFLEQMILGNDLSDLPLYNFFAQDVQKFGEAYVNRVKKYVEKTLGEEQKAAFRASAAMPASTQLVIGMGGAGKSRLIELMALYCYLTGDAGRVHILSNTNETLSELAWKIHDRLQREYRQALKDKATHKGKTQEGFSVHEPIVVRRHASWSEKEISRKPAKLANAEKRKEGKIAYMEEASPETIATLSTPERLRVDMLMYQTFTSKQDKRKDSVKDKRVKYEWLSEGVWVLRFAGYKDANGVVSQHALDQSEHECVRVFRHYFARIILGEKLDSKETGHLTDAHNQIAAIVAARADVILESSSNLHGRVIAEGTRALFIDEAPKADEVECVCAIAKVDAPTFLFGDCQQPKPVGATSGPMKKEDGTFDTEAQDTGPFPAQDSLSFVHRLVLNGFPFLRFSHQFRYVNAVAKPLAKLGYVGLTTDPSVMKLAGAKSGQALFKKLFDVDEPIFCWNDNSGEEVSDGQSWANPRICGLAMTSAANMLKNGTQGKKIAIVTPYKYDLKHLNALREKSIIEYMRQGLKSYAIQMADIKLIIADDLQGNEADFIIMVIPNMSKLRFVKENARIILMITRCRFGLHIITAWSSLMDNSQGNLKFMKTGYALLMKHMLDIGHVTHIDRLSEDDKARFELPFPIESDFFDKAIYIRANEDAKPLQELIQPSSLGISRNVFESNENDHQFESDSEQGSDAGSEEDDDQGEVHRYSALVHSEQKMLSIREELEKARKNGPTLPHLSVVHAKLLENLEKELRDAEKNFKFRESDFKKRSGMIKMERKSGDTAPIPPPPEPESKKSKSKSKKAPTSEIASEGDGWGGDSSAPTAGDDSWANTPTAGGDSWANTPTAGGDSWCNDIPSGMAAAWDDFDDTAAQGSTGVESGEGSSTPPDGALGNDDPEAPPAFSDSDVPEPDDDGTFDGGKF